MTVMSEKETMATVKLTKTLIEDAKPRGKRYSLWDSVVPGFVCRISTKGKKTYAVTYRTVDGTQRWPVVGTHGAITLEQAREIASNMLAEARAGGDPSQSRMDARRAPTVADVCDRYLEEYAKPYKKPLSVADDEMMIRKYVKPKLGSRKIASLVFKDVERVHRELKHIPVRANRVRSLISKMLNLCEKWGIRPQNSNPCRHISRYPERQVHRPLNELEIARLAKRLTEAERGQPVEDPKTGKLVSIAENPRAVAAIRLMMFTGARRNEILRLRWDEVDLEASLIRLADTKTGAKIIRLNSAAREVLEAQEPMVGNPFVFPSSKLPRKPLYDVNGPWRRIRKRARLEDVRLHDLRHNFAAAAAAGGLSLFQIGQLLGHRSPKTTARYSDLTDDPAQKAMEQVGAVLAKAMDRKGDDG